MQWSGITQAMGVFGPAISSDVSHCSVDPTHNVTDPEILKQLGGWVD